MSRAIIQQALQEANTTFFSPRAMSLALLKDYPQAIPTVAQWLYEDWHVYDSSLTQERLIRSFHQRLNDDKIPVTFVAVKNATPIGVISLKEQTDPELSDFPKNSIWLGSLHVIPEERNKGLGQELLKNVAAIAKRLGIESVYLYLSNSTGVEWCRKRGAHVIEKRPFRGHEITIMGLSLSPIRDQGQTPVLKPGAVE